MSRDLAKVLERADKLRNTPHAAEAARQVRIAVRAAHEFPRKNKTVDNADRRLRKMLSSLKK
jgi:hypothetical protein